MLLDVVGAESGGEAPHIAPRREHNAFAPVRQSALHCFGVDFLSNKDVLGIFAGFEPENVEWLDDSSCNVVFADEDAPQRVLKELAAPVPPEGGPSSEHWTVTKPLTVGQPPAKQKAKGGKARAPRTFQLELRLATEADRKDPGHSGHTDSIYYNHVKEQQAIQRQEAENRRMKKRQRRSRLPSAADAELEAATAAVDAAMGGGSASGSGAAAPSGAGSAGEGQASSTAGGAAAADAPAAATSPLPRLGLRGPLDPLLFLRASSGPAGGAGPAAGGGADSAAGEGADQSQSQRKNEDLLSALRRAEAEYTAVLQPEAKSASAEPPASQQERGRPRSRPLPGRQGRQATPGRGRKRTPGGTSGRDRTPAGTGGRERTPPPRPAQDDNQQHRGRKRRPVEQEPRAVSSAAPPPRKAVALPEVEAFLAEHRVKCQRYQLRLTFRSIKFGQQKKKPSLPFGGKPARTEGAAEQAGQPEAKKGDETSKEFPQAGQPEAKKGDEISKDAAAGGKQTEVASKDAAADGKQAEAAKKEELPPWERYLQANHFFVQHGQFMHTVAWEAQGRQILTVVPHPLRVDMDRLARAVQKPRGAIRQRKLKDLEKQTGWPVFVCPPFGHPKDSEGRAPMLLVDSTAIESKKPLLFDCGSVGLSIHVSEFFRSTGAACIEGLARAAEPTPAPTGLPAAAGQGVPAQAAAASSPEPAPEPGPSAAPAQAAPEPHVALVADPAPAQAMET